jgi:hypothetical protein
MGLPHPNIPCSCLVIVLVIRNEAPNTIMAMNLTSTSHEHDHVTLFSMVTENPGIWT